MITPPIVRHDVLPETAITTYCLWLDRDTCEGIWTALRIDANATTRCFMAKLAGVLLLMYRLPNEGLDARASLALSQAELETLTFLFRPDGTPARRRFLIPVFEALLACYAQDVVNDAAHYAPGGPAPREGGSAL